MKLASTSAIIMYKSKGQSGHPWQTPCLRVKGSDKKPFILTLNWMLVNELNEFVSRYNRYDRYYSCSRSNTHGAEVSLEVIN